MKEFEVIRTIVFALPMGLFVAWGLFLVVVSSTKVRKLDMFLRRILSFYTIFSTISGVMFFIYYCLPDLFPKVDLLYYTSMLITPVIFYHFLFFAVVPHKHFSKNHYIGTVIICIGLVLLKLVFPIYWAQYSEQSLLILALIWGIIYTIFPVYEIYKYQLSLATETGSIETINKVKSAQFIGEVLAYPCILALFPLMTGHYPGIFASVILMLILLFTLKMNIPLVYSMIRHFTSSGSKKSLFSDTHQPTSPTIETSFNNSSEKETKPQKRDKTTLTNNKKINISGKIEGKLDRKLFNEYFRKNKPYLNPDLTINDLAELIKSNRTYISKFINQTYSMNFNTYVNLYRLKEMERLLTLPSNKGKNAVDLISQTGFGNYRNYLRAKKQFKRTDNTTFSTIN